MLDVDAFRRADWVLTTYETLRDYQHSFGSLRWAVIIYDEAQKIKTPAALMTEAAQAMHAEFVLAVTGTPVENRLADLWSIVDTAQPGLLGDLKSFSHQYESSSAVESGSLLNLKRALDESEPEPPHHPKPMLRRLKSQHLPALPPKHDHLYPVQMDGEQLRLYDTVVEEARKKDGRDRGHMLKVLQNLRSLSLHPLLDRFDATADEEFIRSSARFRATFEILDQIADRGEKALVFLESRLAQPVLLGLIQRRYRLPKPPLLINGEVAGPHRKHRVDEFQGRPGFDVMILSPRAGGVGLTLTAANHVIHLSRWWNPAVEDQSTDRVYRIGQSRSVHVYYPLAVHPRHRGQSFDEKLDDLLNRKRQLSQSFLMPAAFTEQDFQELYGATVSPGSPDR